MVFSLINSENVFDLYEEAKDYTDKLTANFPEYARIKRNEPHPDVPKRFPKTTDGTTASIIDKTPKRVVQQLPTGVIESDVDYDPLPILADYIYRKKILPKANYEYDLIQKNWNTIEDGMAFGSKAIYTALLMNDGELIPDYIPVYWGDLSLQPGKKSGYSARYVFIRTWWQPSDIDILISEETSRKESAKKSGQKYKSPWKIDALKSIQTNITAKDDKATTPDEKRLALEADGIEIVTALQVGQGAKFFTFNPDTKEIIREEANRDPRGKMPIDWYYYDTDGSNPLGRSIMRLIGPIQNLIDSDMQAYQYNRAMALQPPLVVKNVNPARIIYAPGAINKLEENGRIDAMNIDTSAIRDYPSLYGLQKSQLLNLVNSPDTSISAEVGNPGFGKTPQAIKTNNETISVDDNAVRKGFDAFWENWSETAINMWFYEREGVEELEVDEETANKLKEVHYPVSDNNVVEIDYSSITDGKALRFRVNAGTSKVSSESAQLEALQILVSTLDGSAGLSQVVPIEKKLKAWNAIVANSGIEDSDDLKVSDDELEAMQNEMMMQEQPISEEEQLEQPMEEQPIIEEAVAEQPQPSEDDLITQMLIEIGVDEDLVAEVPAMIDKGYTNEEIIASLEGVMRERIGADNEQ